MTKGLGGYLDLRHSNQHRTNRRSVRPEDPTHDNEGAYRDRCTPDEECAATKSLDEWDSNEEHDNRNNAGKCKSLYNIILGRFIAHLVATVPLNGLLSPAIS